MATQRLGIIMHGVTGRMGMNQHLIRSIKAIRGQGGVALANGDRVMPDPILVGRIARRELATQRLAEHPLLCDEQPTAPRASESATSDERAMDMTGVIPDPPANSSRSHSTVPVNSAAS